MSQPLSGLDHAPSRLVLGTTDPVFSDPVHAADLLDCCRALGGNCIDTALNYLDAEVAIGRWVRARGNRDQVLILTKGAHHDRERQRVTPADIRADLVRSLDRLQTDYVDLYVLHRDDPDQPVGPVLECLAGEQAAGRIRAAGASNWTVPRLEEAAAYAAAHALPGFVLSSPQFSLAFPNQPVWPNCVTARDRYSREWYARTGMPLFAWSPLGSGLFSNRYPPRSAMSPAEREESLRNPTELVRVYYSDRNFARLARANELARRRGCRAVQVALAWVLSQPLNVYAVVGPRTEAELAELFGAAVVRLSAPELAWLDLESDVLDPGGTPPPVLP